MKLQIFRFLPFTRAEGPGNRACIWVQGCKLRCTGCFNAHFWDLDGGFTIDTEELYNQIIMQKDIEGVTFLGGEPFLQAEALAQLGKKLKGENLSIVTFTGYTLEHLRALEDKHVNDLLEITDLLIDGPYKKELRTFERPWIGSSNQRYIFMTDRYRYLEEQMNSFQNRVEIQIEKDGLVSINGMADFEKLLDWLEEEEG